MLLSKKVIQNVTYITVGNILSRIIRLVGFIYIINGLGASNYGTYLFILSFVEAFDLIALNGINKYGVRESSKNVDNTGEIINMIFGGKMILSVISYLSLVLVAYMTGIVDSELFSYVILHGLMVFVTSFSGMLLIIFSHMKRCHTLLTFLYYNLSYSIFGSFAIYSGFGLMSILVINLLTHFFLNIWLYVKSLSLVKFKLSFMPILWSKKTFRLV